jgi:serine phosphatase RsbU (regulator of sigma subunit)
MATMANHVKSTQMRQVLRRASGQVRWKLAAIMVFTGISTLLVACLAAAALNVVVRRESANVVEKQVQVLVQASRSVASAIPDNTGSPASPVIPAGLKPLLAYTDEVFPQAQVSLTVEGAGGMQSVLRGSNRITGKLPNWLAQANFAGLVADNGRLEIRNVVTRQRDSSKATAIFSLPLGPELARRLSSASGMEVTPVLPRPFRVHSPGQRVLRTIEGNFIPGMSRSAAVVLTVRNWESGAPEDWIAYSVRPGYLSTFEDVTRLGTQLANWVWFGAALATMVFLMYATGVWICLRLGTNIGTAIDNLSAGASQVARGNFAWRTPVRGDDQLGDLSRSFNEMVVALERLQREETAALRNESELLVARSVQEYLFPRLAPEVRGVTVAGRTLAARTVGGDLYDFFDLGQRRIGILCADVSGKGIPAALMMANLQAVARAHVSEKNASFAPSPGHWVEILNRDLTGRFGDNRYATLFWAEYSAETSILTYVNAGNPAPILIHSDGLIERLESDSFPVGMFASAHYTARESAIQPGSRLVIFTDGLTDAQNAAGEEFGDERLTAFCRTIASGIDAKRSAEILMQAVSEWSIGTEQFDDTTVVVVDIAA